MATKLNGHVALWNIDACRTPAWSSVDLPHALVEWGTVLIVTREGDHRCKLRPSQRAVIALVHLREHTTYAELSAGFRIGEGTAHPYAQSVIKLLAARAPSLPQALRRARPAYVLVDGTIAECDRVGDHGRDYSGKARRHGVNIQAVTDPAGELIWYAPALPGRTVDITAARTHRIVTVCERLRIPVLADKAYAGGRQNVPGAVQTTPRTPSRHETSSRPPCTRTTPLPCRAGLRPPQGLTDLSRSPHQPQPTHVNHEGRSHPRATTLKILSGHRLLADKGYQGAGPAVRVPYRGRWKSLSEGQQAVNRSQAKIRGLVEPAVATLKTWRLLRKLRCPTTRITNLVQPDPVEAAGPWTRSSRVRSNCR